MVEVFKYHDYSLHLQQQLNDFLNTGKKYYFDCVCNLLDVKSFHCFCEDFPESAYKDILGNFKYDADVFLCLKAETIINKKTESEDHFYDEILMCLKRLEYCYGVKPHLVITYIDIESMYDLVFSFETYFQKLWYRTWEKYKIKNIIDEHSIFSDDVLENDDHIPAMKNLNFFVNYDIHSWKTMAILTQMYLDAWIWLVTDYRLFCPFIDLSLDSQHSFNSLWNLWYLSELYQKEQDPEHLYDLLKNESDFVKRSFSLFSNEPLSWETFWTLQPFVDPSSLEIFLNEKKRLMKETFHDTLFDSFLD